MPKRPSGVADGDDHSHNARLDTPDPRQMASSTSDSQRNSFSSAKFDAARHSETIDRRRADKSASPAPAEDWHPELDFDDEEDKDKSPGLGRPLGNRKADLNSKQSPVWRSPWRISLLTLAVTSVALAILVALVNSFFTRQVDPKGCRLCYMYPGYAKLDGFDTEHTRFASKYSLYLYREIGVDEDTRVKGVPVLFITGNAGSYKQVRPIAAEAARYFAEHVQQDESLIKSGTRSLDFFTADFNEDITAFHGQTLLDQAEYLNDAVAYILSLYHDPNRSNRDPGLPDPTSVIVVGHSMGGIVARTMLVMPNYQTNSINTIITMSAPHARAPVSFDADIVSTYQNINDYWRQAYSQKWANDNPLWHVTLVSIAGGGLDTIVPSDYASLSSLVPDTHGFTVFTSSIPNVWTGSDHLSILWCDQMRKVMVRAILDIVDVNRPSQTKPRANRMKVFKKWFLTGMERTVEKTLPDREPTTLLTLEANTNSILSAGQRLVIGELGRTGKPKAHLLPIPPHSRRDAARFTLLSNQALDDVGGSGSLEVLFCSVHSLHHGQSASLFAMNMDLSNSSTGSTRLACKNAAPDTIKLPASTPTSAQPFEEVQPFSYLQYDSESIGEHQFVAIVDKGQPNDHGWLVADFATPSQSQTVIRSGLRALLTKGVHLTLPAERPLVNDISIPAMHSSMLAYKLRLGAHPCGGGREIFTPLVRQYIQEPYESKFFVNVKEANINLHGVAPFMPAAPRAHTMTDGVSLQIWADPTCESPISVSLDVDIFGSLGKLYMRYRTVFPAIPLVIVALVLRKQFMTHDRRGVFITFTDALDQCLRSSLSMLLLAMTLFGMSISASSPHPGGAPPVGLFAGRHNATESSSGYLRHEILMGSQDPFFWFLVPLCGLVSVGICVLMNYFALLVVRIAALMVSSISQLRSWMRSGDAQRRNLGPAFAAPSPMRRFILTSILLFLVATIIPYQFAYMVACVVQIATCTRAQLHASEARSASSYNFYNYAHSILVLMLWVLPCNIPVFIVWVRNLQVAWFTQWSSHHSVLSIAPFILLVEMMTGGKMIPRLSPRFRYITNTLYFTLAVWAAVFGITYAYQLHMLANVICFWLVIVHFSAVRLSPNALGALLIEPGSTPSTPIATESKGRTKKRP